MQNINSLLNCCVLIFPDKSVNHLVILLFLLFTLKVIFIQAKQEQASRVVQTTHGRIQGLKEHYKGTELEIFLGIPYGKPPTGNMRFRRAERVENWRGVRETTELPPTCPHFNDTSFDRMPGVEMWNPNTRLSEDCLYLNVWAPAKKSKKPRAVMVWIFGGGFYSGSATLGLYDGRNLAAEYDVIVVSMQYRFGPLGFLYLGDSDAPGNAGLVDQQLSLQWIQNNIAQFGGDAKRVTLFGESAGAASVSYHLLSPISQPLFNNAIMQSGSAFTSWGFHTQEKALKRSRDLASRLGCNTNSNREILKCLYEVEPLKLLEESFNYGLSTWDAPIGPTVDGYFIKESPAELVKRGAFKKTDIIIGMNKNEGSWFLVYDHMDILHPFSTKSITEEQFRTILETSVGDRVVKNRIVYDAVDYEYAVANRNGATYLNLIDSLFGDLEIACPVIAFADHYADSNNKVYTFYLEHRTKNYPWGEWMGAIHGIDVDYVFGNPVYNFTEDEKKLVHRIMAFWTNFAKTG